MEAPDPLQGTFPVITVPEGLLDRIISTSNEDFAGAEVGIVKMPLLATCTQKVQRESKTP